MSGPAAPRWSGPGCYADPAQIVDQLRGGVRSELDPTCAGGATNC